MLMSVLSSLAYARAYGLVKTSLYGGSVAEWSGRRTRNPAVPSLSLTPTTTCICTKFLYTTRAVLSLVARSCLSALLHYYRTIIVGFKMLLKTLRVFVHLLVLLWLKKKQRIRQVKPQHNTSLKWQYASDWHKTLCHICCVTTSQSQPIIHLEIDFFYCIRCLQLTFVICRICYFPLFLID